MALFKKKPDPISDRARALNAEIAALEVKIKKLDSQLQQDHSHPRLRSTAVPRGLLWQAAEVAADESRWRTASPCWMAGGLSSWAHTTS